MNWPSPWFDATADGREATGPQPAASTYLDIESFDLHRAIKPMPTEASPKWQVASRFGIAADRTALEPDSLDYAFQPPVLLRQFARRYRPPRARPRRCTTKFLPGLQVDSTHCIERRSDIVGEHARTCGGLAS
jgi:hypothetical protein